MYKHHKLKEMSRVGIYVFQAIQNGYNKGFSMLDTQFQAAKALNAQGIFLFLTTLDFVHQAQPGYFPVSLSL